MHHKRLTFDLAVSNIFPGDVLTKNFGVTRRGRVVFYDYDELCFLTDCNFRDLPQATTYEEEISAEPWFSVRENDVFLKSFSIFSACPDRRVPRCSNSTRIYFIRISGAACNGSFERARLRKYFHIGRSDGLLARTVRRITNEIWGVGSLSRK